MKRIGLGRLAVLIVLAVTAISMNVVSEGCEKCVQEDEGYHGCMGGFEEGYINCEPDEFGQFCTVSVGCISAPE